MPSLRVSLFGFRGIRSLFDVETKMELAQLPKAEQDQYHQLLSKYRGNESFQVCVCQPHEN